LEYRRAAERDPAGERFFNGGNAPLIAQKLAERFEKGTD